MSHSGKLQNKYAINPIIIIYVHTQYALYHQQKKYIQIT